MTDDPEWIDPITAERIMRGARSESPVDHEPLADLLAAAAAPARPGELAGEEAAVTAFRDVHVVIAPRPRRRFTLRSVLMKTSVVAAVAVAGGGGVGVALAAGGGHLPGTGSPADHANARHVSTMSGATTARTHAGRHTSRQPAATGTHGAGTHGTRAASSHDAKPSDRPAPNLRGLCIAFRAHKADDPGKALDNPAFKTLIKTAGGRDKVESYCHTLLAGPAGKPSTHPGKPPGHTKSHPHHSPPVPSHPAPTTTNTHIP